MSKQLRYERELERITAEISTIENQLADKRSLLSYLAELSGEATPALAADSKLQRRRNGKGLNLEAAIAEILRQHGQLTTPQISAEMTQIGFKKSSVYSAISGMKKNGALVAHQHDGRGSFYALP
jgi:hypothetical protein